jgi:hypothetical protein
VVWWGGELIDLYHHAYRSVSDVQHSGKIQRENVRDKPTAQRQRVLPFVPVKAHVS